MMLARHHLNLEANLLLQESLSHICLDPLRGTQKDRNILCLDKLIYQNPEKEHLSF